MVFNRADRERSHNRTDVNDRNLGNIYGDAQETRRRQQRQQDQEEQKTPNANRRHEGRTPMPDNPFDNSFRNEFAFGNFGTRAPPSRPSESRQNNGPTRINLSRANMESGNPSGGKNLQSPI